MDPTITLALSPEADPDFQRRQKEAEAERAAAVQAVPFSFAGKILAPFTPSRERAFHEHREALNAMPWHECLTSPTAFMADGARLLYFLAHDPAQWLNFLALQPKGYFNQEPGTKNQEPVWRENNAHAALEVEIQQWTDTVFTGGIDERNEVYRLCQKIITRASVTRATPQTEGPPSGN